MVNLQKVVFDYKKLLKVEIMAIILNIAKSQLLLKVDYSHIYIEMFMHLSISPTALASNFICFFDHFKFVNGALLCKIVIKWRIAQLLVQLHSYCSERFVVIAIIASFLLVKRQNEDHNLNKHLN